LVKDLHNNPRPEYLTRAQLFAARIIKLADSVAAAADLVEDFARSHQR
jgi:hypothetical protein